MGICEMLTMVFVVLKLFGVISWSWWLVFAPEFIAVIIYIILTCVWMNTFFKINDELKK